MCTRAKNHSDLQAGQGLSTAASDVVSAASSQAASGSDDGAPWVTGFQQIHGADEFEDIFLLNSISIISSQGPILVHLGLAL